MTPSVSNQDEPPVCTAIAPSSPPCNSAALRPSGGSAADPSVPLPLRSGDTATTAAILGMGKDELQTAVGLSVPEAPRYLATQVWDWVHKKGAPDFQAMTNISKPLRDRLSQAFSIRYPTVASEQLSGDGTYKWLLDLAAPATASSSVVSPGSSEQVEAVYIPDFTRATLCVSSQIGCTLTCKFCHTGTQKLVRNLTAAEIVGQVLIAKQRIGDWARKRAMLTNVVFMGMGEPLLNYDNVVQAIRILTDSRGLAIPKRKITVSTSGIVPVIPSCAEDTGVRLAISLHAVNNRLRDQLVPINRRYPLAELLAACRRYADLTNGERITFEYVMLHEVNDSDSDARELVRLIRGIPAKVNLIPFNPWPGSPFSCSTPARIASFAAIVEAGGYVAPVRQPRGQDIMAACGQLRSDSQKIAAAAGRMQNPAIATS